jgi:hypothetical protein
MCSSKNPSIADQRTTAERSTVNYETNLPWELTAGCKVTIGDTIGLFTQGHMDFSREHCNTHKHISMQQQKQYVRTNINSVFTRVIHAIAYFTLLIQYLKITGITRFIFKILRRNFHSRSATDKEILVQACFKDTG